MMFFSDSREVRTELVVDFAVVRAETVDVEREQLERGDEAALGALLEVDAVADVRLLVGKGRVEREVAFGPRDVWLWPAVEDALEM